MARVAARRTRSPESDDDNSSRPETPLSTAPNDRKRIRPSAQLLDSGSDNDDSNAGPSATQASRVSQEDRKPTFFGRKPKTINDQHHQPGAIVRVKLINFVTYKSVEFFPGPSLNMVIGPNGTGKSTLVCAIALGLGYSPSILGRAKDVGEYVKHGQNEAVIEIELKGGARLNTIITRTIKKDGNQSTFTMSHGNSSERKSTSLRLISAFRASLNIQCDNLCQFLPQDKVVEFAQMSPVELLNSTQLAAGSAEMIQWHDALKKLRIRHKELMGSNRGDRGELEILQRRQEARRTDVERLRERKIHQQRLEWLKKAKVIPEYLVAKDVGEQAKANQKRLARELVQLKKDSAPALRDVNTKKAYMGQTKAAQAEKVQIYRQAGSRADECERAVEECKQNSHEHEANMNAEKNSIQQKKAAKAKHQHAIRALEHKKSQEPPVLDFRAVNQDLADRREEVRDMNRQVTNAKGREEELFQQGRTRNGLMRALEQQIEGLETQAGQQMSRLEAISKDTAKAWEWIQENPTLFEKPVLGPPAVECTLENPAIAGAVEAFLAKSDFKILTAQTENDYAMLQQKLSREQKLRDISLRTCSAENLDEYRAPYRADELRAMGLDSYAIDHIRGPPAVLAVLCMEKKLHTAAISRGEISSEQHNRLMHSNVQAYFSNGRVHRFLRNARYGNENTIEVSELASNATMWTDQQVDLGRKAALSREVAEAKGEIDLIKQGVHDCREEIKTLEAKIANSNEEIQTIEADKTQKQQELTQWNALPQRILDEQRKLEAVDAWLAGAKTRRDESLVKIADSEADAADALIQYQESIHALREALEEVIRSETLHAEASSDFGVFAQRNEGIKAAMEHKTNEERKATDRAHEAVHKSQELGAQAREVGKEAKALTKANPPVDGFFELIQEMSNDKWTHEVWQGKVESCQASISLTEGGDDSVIRQFERDEETIRKVQERLASFNLESAGIRSAITEIREKWEPEIESLVEKISESFSENFARIGCAGTVEVFKANSDAEDDKKEENGGMDNGLDFANWAVHISVKFREDEPLSLLDSHRQSGGERAVSTIFYLMALQSLSRAPFRVVDEINQGMDSRNERMMHGRMVDIATRKSEGGSAGSQYFLITPKLLSGLDYRPGMTVHCIVSGELMEEGGALIREEHQDKRGWKDAGVKRYPMMDFRTFAKIGREKGLGRAGNGSVVGVSA